MSQVVGRGDGDQSAQQPGVDRGGRGATRVEVQGEEADGEVQRFAGDFVPVDEGAPVSVDRDQSQRARRAADFSPIGGDSRNGGGGGEVTIRRGGRGGRSFRRGRQRVSSMPGGSVGAAAARSGAFSRAGVRG